MLHAVWRGGSLRAWIAMGMAIAVLPLATSALAGYLLLSRGVLASFQDVAARQRDQIDPTQRLRLLIWDASTPLDNYLDEGDPRLPAVYRAARQRVEAAFPVLRAHMRADPELGALVDRAREDWSAADKYAGEALSVRRAPGDTAGAALMNEFQAASGAAVDKLGAVYDDLAADLRSDHDAALLDVERSEWLAVAAVVVSGVAILVGVLIIGRVMAGSVERLVTGAELFAAGDREHRIDVQVPPELQRVAEEFNRMIGRIHESEDALANLARRDSLTLLLNRRAFDEELIEAFARQQRAGERFALLMLDLDRFKQINDTYGHAVGDDVLRATARAIAAEVRPFDRVFRMGGEEFGVILSGSDHGTARLAAERLRQAVAAMSIVSGKVAIGATVSVGVAVARDGSGPGELIAAADAALYRAKDAGRNCVMVSGDGDASA